MKLISIFNIAIILNTASCKPVHHTQSSGATGMNSQPGMMTDHGANDSTTYVEEIKAAKAKYLNKPFSVLLHDLTIPVRSYSSHFNDRVTSSGIMISFNDRSTTTNKSEGVNEAGAPVQLFIEWDQPVLRTDIETQLKVAAGEWHDAEQQFYAPRIVKDIR